MGEFGRILTNLGLAYGLMSKEQFVEKVAQYAQEKNMSEEKMMSLIESLFEELEITHKRRQARQMYEAYRMKKASRNPENSEFFDDIFGSDAEFAPKDQDDDMYNEMRSLRVAIEKLTEALKNKPEGE